MIAFLRPLHHCSAHGNRTGPDRDRRSGRFGLAWAALWVFVWGTMTPLQADLPAQTPRYSSEFFTHTNGLPAGEISHLAQSSDGYLWLAMSTGLARFDGVKFDQYDRRNTPVFADDRITALATDRLGRIWAGTTKGLVGWDRGRFKNVALDEAVVGSAVTALAPASDGGLWVATPSALIKVGVSTALRRFSRPAALGAAVIGSLQELAGGHLLAGGPSGWTELDPATGLYQDPPGTLFSGPQVRAVLPEDAQGTAWALDARGVLRHTFNGWERLTEFPIELAGKAAGLYRDPAGGMLVWLNGLGVCHWENERSGLVRIEPTEPGPLDRPTAVLRDAEQNLWIATTDGLVRLHSRIAALWTVKQGLPNQMCWSASTGTDGRIWVGTEGGIGVISETGSTLALSGPLATNAVRLVLAAHDNRVWCVVADHTVYWSDMPQAAGSWHLLPLGERRVKVLYEDPAGNIWAGTDAGAVKIAGRTPSAIPFKGQESLIPFEVSAIHQDRSGATWFGTQAGVVFRFVDQSWQRFSGPETIGDGAIACMHEDSSGGMWFGTSRGIAYCADRRWRLFGPDQGIGDQPVQGIYEDKAKNFWLAGQRGLQRVGRSELEAVATGTLPRAFPLSLGPLDGVEAYDFASQRQPGGALDRLGQLWLPTAQGMLQVDPHRLRENSVAPPVVIEGASFEGRPVDEGLVRQFCSPAARSDSASAAKPESLRIPQDRGHYVQLHFTANTFLRSDKVLFRYRLTGYEPDWQPVGNGRVATYHSLPPGDYAFEVQAANSPDAWNSRGPVFRFSLVPRFYETRWFIIVCALVVVLAVFGFARRHYRSNEQRLRGDRLALEQERSRIARDLHDDLGANLTGLAMQAEIAGKQLDGPGSEELQRFAVTTRGLAQRLREVIWAVDPESDTLESLTAFLGQQTDQLLGPTRLRYRFEAPPHLPVLTLRAGTRHQLAMSAREAINNILKYAQASEVKVRIELADDTLTISIRDDGIGLPTGSVTSSGRSVLGGNGLKNIRQRLKSLGGNFRVSSVPGAGTLIRLEVPLAAVTAVDSKPENPNEHQSRDR